MYFEIWANKSGKDEYTLCGSFVRTWAEKIATRLQEAHDECRKSYPNMQPCTYRVEARER